MTNINSSANTQIGHQENPSATKRFKRHMDSFHKAQELSYFRFQYTHRRFKTDCDTGGMDFASAQNALASVSHDFVFEDDFCRFSFIHRLIGHYHNQIYGDENPYDLTPHELDEDIAECIARTSCLKEDDTKLLHSLAYKYGYNPILLLENIIKAEDLLVLTQVCNCNVSFLPTSWSFLRESKEEPLFFIRDLCRVERHSGHGGNLFYAYIDVMSLDGNYKKSRQQVRKFSKQVVNLLEARHSNEFGDKTTANLQFCINKSNINQNNTRWKVQLEEEIYLQTLYYRNYLTPFYLTGDEINRILWKIDGISHEQAGARIRLIGLTLWDLVNDAASTEGFTEKPFPPQLLHYAIAEVEKIIPWRRADGRKRNYHRDYLLADLCIKEMDLRNANQVTDKISAHFTFDNVY